MSLFVYVYEHTHALIHTRTLTHALHIRTHTYTHAHTHTHTVHTRRAVFGFIAASCGSRTGHDATRGGTDSPCCNHTQSKHAYLSVGRIPTVLFLNACSSQASTLISVLVTNYTIWIALMTPLTWLSVYRVSVYLCSRYTRFFIRTHMAVLTWPLPETKAHLLSRISRASEQAVFTVLSLARECFIEFVS